MRRYGLAVLAAGWLVAGVWVAGPASAQGVEVGGEVRPRFEARDPSLGAMGGTQEQTSMRTRLSLSAEVLETVRAFVQLQDVRVWGGESGTTDPMADGLDLHQGWVEVERPGKAGFSARVGRQELSYGGERLVGALNWAQQARSFDGVRLRLRPADGVMVDGLAAQVGDVDGGQADESFLGLYGVVDGPVPGAIDGYVLYHDRDRVVGRSGPGGLRTAELSKKLTAGGRWVWVRGPVSGRIEAAYQAGEAVADPAVEALGDVAAYLVAARVGAELAEGVAVSLWYDFLSGDDDPGDGEVRVFDTLFATNHKFYGFMDLFLDIPAHTAGRGLQDLVVKASYEPAPDHSVGVDLHSFRVAAAGGLDSGHVGEELDLTYRWIYGPGAVLTAGASYFRGGDGPRLPRIPDSNPVWAFVMLDVTF